MFIQPCADGLTAANRAPFVPSGCRVSPSYFRVVGRSHELAFTVTHDLSVTINVVCVELTSLDVDPKMAFDVAYHGFAAGHATPGPYMVVPGLIRFFFFFFGCFNIFLHGSFRLLRAGLLLSASDDVWEWKSLLSLRWGAHPVAQVTLESFSTSNQSDYEHKIWKKVLRSMRSLKSRKVRPQGSIFSVWF